MLVAVQVVKTLTRFLVVASLAAVAPQPLERGNSTDAARWCGIVCGAGNEIVGALRSANRIVLSRDALRVGASRASDASSGLLPARSTCPSHAPFGAIVPQDLVSRGAAVGTPFLLRGPPAAI